MKARLLVLFLLGAVAAATAPAQPNLNARPPLLRDVGIEQRLNTALPLDLPFLDESGRAVHLKDYFGRRPVVLVLAYYNCPMLCTQVLNGLSAALQVLSFDVGSEFEVVTVSFDPRDPPAAAAAKKKAYVERYARPGAARGWHFLTGGQSSITRLVEAVGFRYAYDKGLDQFAHASGLFVATPGGRLSRYFYGIEYGPRDLRLALVEASANRIGSPVDQILLYCYHYDPATGKYGPAVLNMVRLGGGATVVALAGFLLTMRRRDRRRTQAASAELPAAR